MEKEREKVFNENDETSSKSQELVQNYKDNEESLGTNGNHRIDTVNSNVQNDADNVKQKKQKRTKTGCFGCRLRRKKCDELHPICSGCKSSKTECIWPQSGKAVLTKHMRDELKKHTIKKRVSKKEYARENQIQPKLEKRDFKRKPKTVPGTTILAGEKVPMQFESSIQMNEKANMSRQIEGNGNASAPGMAINSSKSKFDPELDIGKQQMAFINYTTTANKKKCLVKKKASQGKKSGKHQNATLRANTENDNMDETLENTANSVQNMSVSNNDFANYLFNPTNINESSNFLDKMLDLDIQNGFLMTTFLNNNTDIPMDFLSAPGSFGNGLPTNDISFSLSGNEMSLPRQQKQQQQLQEVNNAEYAGHTGNDVVLNTNTDLNDVGYSNATDSTNTTNDLPQPQVPLDKYPRVPSLSNYVTNSFINGVPMHTQLQRSSAPYVPCNPSSERTMVLEHTDSATGKQSATETTTTNSGSSSSGSGDDDDVIGLDEEQSEKLYGQLLDRFENWQPTGPVLLRHKHSNNKQELLLYYTFFNYFLPKVGPQKTLPELSTMQTFPNVEQNSIVNNVFMCCGATFLAWVQPQKYTVIAETLYEESKKNLKELQLTRYDQSSGGDGTDFCARGDHDGESSSSSSNNGDNSSGNNSTGDGKHSKRIYIRGDEDWLIACFQLLVLRDKLYNGQGVVDRCIENLSHSFSIIKKRYLLDDSLSTTQVMPTTPVDRMLLESFLYNYTVSVSVAKKLDDGKLPNPFSPVITKLVSMLKLPLFENCEVEWLNNPVLGPSVDVFIMLAKVSFLGRLHLPLEKNSIWDIRASELLQQCLYYSPPNLPDKIKADRGKYSVYRPGLLCGSIVSKSCYLLLYKIINYGEMDDKEILFNPDIQSVVKYAIEALVDIAKDDNLLCILQWALLILGAFTVEKRDQLIIREYTRSIGATIHSHSGSKIKDHLEAMWASHDLGLLFDREKLSQLVI